jgi:hypothetical protein
MGLNSEELQKRAAIADKNGRERLKANYALARRLGFTSAESVILQSHKTEVIINIAIERGLIQDANDPKITALCEG